jgi:hypothetical protein
VRRSPFRRFVELWLLVAAFGRKVFLPAGPVSQNWRAVQCCDEQQESDMIGLSLLALLAPAASAAAPASASAARPAPIYLMAKEEGKLLCRRVTQTDSRIPTRVCRTELQWEEIARENQEEFRSSRNKRL